MDRVSLSSHTAGRAVSHRIVKTHFGIQRDAIKSAKRRGGKTDGVGVAEPKETVEARPSVVPWPPRFEPRESSGCSTVAPDRKPNPLRRRPETGRPPSPYSDSPRHASPPGSCSAWRPSSAQPAARRGRATAPGSGSGRCARRRFTPVIPKFNSPAGWSEAPKRRPVGRLARIAPTFPWPAIRPSRRWRTDRPRCSRSCSCCTRSVREPSRSAACPHRSGGSSNSRETSP